MENLQTLLDSAKRAATAELVGVLLDDANYFADVENFGFENTGFTAENVRELVQGDTLFPFPYGVEVKTDRIDWEAAARSLNEEFGYARHSKRFYVSLQAFRVDELDRERPDLSLLTKEWSPGDDIEVFVAGVRRQLEILLRAEVIREEKANE